MHWCDPQTNINLRKPECSGWVINQRFFLLLTASFVDRIGSHPEIHMLLWWKFSTNQNQFKSSNPYAAKKSVILGSTIVGNKSKRSDIIPGAFGFDHAWHETITGFALRTCQSRLVAGRNRARAHRNPASIRVVATVWFSLHGRRNVWQWGSTVSGKCVESQAELWPESFEQTYTFTSLGTETIPIRPIRTFMVRTCFGVVNAIFFTPLPHPTILIRRRLKTLRTKPDQTRL